MKTSVALCTYNGEKYIKQQLLSIINQTIPVDEIIVGDDNSSDNTVEIINKIKKQCGVNIVIEINKPNLGCCANFEKTIRRCTGDIIFLSDQDDIWTENKVSKILDYFSTNSNKDTVFTNATFMNEKDQRIYNDKTLFDIVGFTRKIRKCFDSGRDYEVFLQSNRATGATMAFRRQSVENFNILRDREKHIYHDYVIALSSLETHSLGYIEEPLIKYRIHSTQTSGLGQFSTNFRPSIYGITICVPLKILKPTTKQHAIMLERRADYVKSFGGHRIIMNYHDYYKNYEKGFIMFMIHDLCVSLYIMIHDL